VVSRCVESIAERQEEPIRSAGELRDELERQDALLCGRDRCYCLLLFEVGPAGRGARGRRLVKAFTGRIRSADKLGWFDDRHIAVILPCCVPDHAMQLARRVCAVTSEALPQVYFFHAGCAGPCRDGRNVPEQCLSCRAASRDSRSVPPVRQRAIPAWKRLMDVVVSSAGLLVLAPLFLVTAAFIKSVSKGPVFFRQERIGYMGRPFRLWKFRTYEHNADTAQHQRHVAGLIRAAQGGAPMHKLDDAPGLIPFGNVLRKTCIDELPQLINVLLGDMSLIGPRPPVAYEVREYDAWHRARLDTIPGMTGLWQVSGKNKLTFNEMVRLDIRYIRSRSLSLDAAILVRTPGAILSQVKEALSRRRHRHTLTA